MTGNNRAKMRAKELKVTGRMAGGHEFLGRREVEQMRYRLDELSKEIPSGKLDEFHNALKESINSSVETQPNAVPLIRFAVRNNVPEEDVVSLLVSLTNLYRKVNSTQVIDAIKRRQARLK